MTTAATIRYLNEKYKGQTEVSSVAHLMPSQIDLNFPNPCGSAVVVLRARVHQLASARTTSKLPGTCGTSMLTVVAPASAVPITSTVIAQ